MDPELHPAFAPLHRLVHDLLPQVPPLVDDESGTRSRITSYEVSTPLELDVVVEGGEVRLGSAPPLYHLETSLMPVLHQVRLLAVVEEET